MSGKGSRPRPFSVDQETFSKNWDRIFKKKVNDQKSSKRLSETAKGNISAEN